MSAPAGLRNAAARPPAAPARVAPGLAAWLAGLPVRKPPSCHWRMLIGTTWAVPSSAARGCIFEALEVEMEIVHLQATWARLPQAGQLMGWIPDSQTAGFMAGRAGGRPGRWRPLPGPLADVFSARVPGQSTPACLSIARKSRPSGAQLRPGRRPILPPPARRSCPAAPSSVAISSPLKTIAAVLCRPWPHVAPKSHTRPQAPSLHAVAL